MEQFPRFPSELSSSEKKGSPSKREQLRVPGLAQIETGGGGTGYQPEAQRFHEAAQVAEPTTGKKTKKRKKKGLTGAPRTEGKKDVQSSTESTAADGDPGRKTKKPDVVIVGKTHAENNKTYEKLPNQELPLHAINGGEVIIDLAALRGEHGQTLEYELPLRTEAADTPPKEGNIDQDQVTNEGESSRLHLDPLEIIHDESGTLEPEIIAAGGGGDDIPPRIPPENFTGATPESPEPERRASYFTTPPEIRHATTAPEEIGTAVYASTMPPAAPRTITASAEQLVTKRELNSAVEEARRAGTGRGLLAGLLLGGSYEHFKHKRREKRREKKYQEVAKKLEQARTEYQFATAEQTRKQDITEYQLHSAEHRLAMSPQTRVSPENVSQPVIAAQEAFRPASMPSATERVPQPVHGEEVRAGKKVKLNAAETEQQLEIPSDQRLVKEGAFIAQVEKATGKLVDKPSFEYGHEYYRERAQEAAPRAQRNVAAGEVALVAAAMSQPGQRSTSGSGSAGGGGATGSGGTSLPPAAIPNATTQGPPTAQVQPSKAADSSDDLHSEQPLWPWIVALIVIVICLFALLH